MPVVAGAAFAVLAAILLAVTVSDLRSFTIPNKLVAALLVLWLVLVCAMVLFGSGAANDGVSAAKNYALRGLCSALLVGGGLFLFSLLFELITSRYSMGGGDVKLVFATSLYMSWQAALLMVGCACVLALLLQAVLPKRAVRSEAGAVGGATSGPTSGAAGGAAGDPAGGPADDAAYGASSEVRVFPLGPAICVSALAFAVLSF